MLQLLRLLQTWHQKLLRPCLNRKLEFSAFFIWLVLDLLWPYDFPPPLSLHRTITNSALRAFIHTMVHSHL